MLQGPFCHHHRRLLLLPAAAAAGAAAADKRALYEFVVRHFLASCSKDAVAFETTVTIDIAGEAFRTTGAATSSNTSMYR
jgi:DNA topoisomerase IA